MHEPYADLSRRTSRRFRDTPSRFYRRNCYLSRAASAPDLQPADNLRKRIGLRDAASIPVSRSWKPAGSGQDFGSINSHYRALAESKQTFDRTSFGTPRTGSEGIYRWRVGSFAAVDEIGREARSHSCQTPIRQASAPRARLRLDDGPPRVGIADVCTIGSMHPCSRPASPSTVARVS
jgi:hypothetical protein